MTLHFAQHKTVLLHILKDIYTDPFLATNLGFKGGTAAMLFYGLPRFSVDLDFDLLDDTHADLVFEKLQKIIIHHGKVMDAYVKKYSVLTVMSYAPGAHKIKIEVNRRSFGSRYELKTLLGISMLVMVPEDVFANKLMALYERIGTTSRDIFDVHFFAQKGWQINQKIVEDRAHMPFKDLLRSCIAMLEKMNNRHILDGLGELLTDTQKDTIRATLKRDVIFSLQSYLHNVS